VNTVGERRAAAIVASRTRELFGGSTHTLYQPSVLRGYWLDSGTLFTDEISILLADVDMSAMNEDGLQSSLDSLRAEALNAYEVCGSPQLEIWITIEDLKRVVSA
jgi:hypothetical protein